MEAAGHPQWILTRWEAKAEQTRLRRLTRSAGLWHRKVRLVAGCDVANAGGRLLRAPVRQQAGHR